MNAGDIMCDEVFTCRASDSLDVAAQLMWEHDCGSIPVVDDDRRVIGVITDRDICMAAWSQGLRLAEIPVSWSMARTVHACTSNDGLEAVERIMREQRVRRVPVVDGERLVGIVSLNDFALAALDGLGIPDAPVSAERVVLTLGSVCQPRASGDGVQRKHGGERASRSSGPSASDDGGSHGSGGGAARGSGQVASGTRGSGQAAAASASSAGSASSAAGRGGNGRTSGGGQPKGRL